MDFDTVIVGAGAAGFFAALAAGQRDKRVLLVEKSNKTGVKILMSGGTRCNITQDTDVRGIVQAFGKNGKFLYSALSHLGPSEVIDWFESHGVPTKVESSGKIFPVSDRAVDVRNALLNAILKIENVHLKTGLSVERIRKSDQHFETSTSRGTFTSHSVVITTGGKSYPGCGTTGDAYPWAKMFGHQIVEPIPALTPIVSSDQWVKNLQGVTLPDVNVGVFEANDVTRISDRNFRKLALDSYRGSMLFTHFGLSGPTALNVSKQISSRTGQNLSLVVDFLPELEFAELEDKLLGQDNQRRTAKSFLQQFLPLNLAQTLVENFGFAPDRKIAEMSKNDRNRLLSCLKKCEIRIEGTRGFKKAEVTSGGVDLKEVNSHTMESKLCSGLFFAGEVLDLDGRIGGYNFQSAFSTGYLAGMNV